MGVQTGRLLPLGIALIASTVICIGTAYSQCMLPEEKLISRRNGTLMTTIKARNLLEAYDEILAVQEAAGMTANAAAMLSDIRGDIFYTALSAYFFAGEQDYPEGASQLRAMLDGLTLDELDNLTFPASLDVLVECGILAHLPRSPYPTGRFLQELPASPQPGDVFYVPIPTYEGYLRELPGLNEGELLLIFGDGYEFGELVTDEMIANMHPDIAPMIPVGKYTTICYLFGQNPNLY